MTGYEAMRSAAAWLDLSERGTILATGEDRARLLHAMTTNNVQQLTPGTGCYAFFLNAQGRILADVNLLCGPDDFILDVEPETRESLYQHLDKYIIADDVALEDTTARTAKIAVEGPGAEAVLVSLAAPIPETDFSHARWNSIIVARLTFTGESGFRLFLPAGEKAEWIARLEAAGAVRADGEAARVVRIEHAKPRYGEDITNMTLAQETQQLHALHFSKGCYLGQEIVERVRSRGLVHRLLAGLHIDSQEAPPPGARLFSNGNNAGKITSAAFSPALRKIVAIAYVGRDFAAPDTVLSIENHPAAVRPPYLMETVTSS